LIASAEPFAKEIVEKYEKRSREKAQRARRTAGLQLVQGRKK
jgi:hypothetical protein